jgi:hypothetical protein
MTTQCTLRGKLPLLPLAIALWAVCPGAGQAMTASMAPVNGLSPLVEKVVVVRRGAAVRGPRGGVAVGRRTVRAAPVRRGAVVVAPRGRWVRPYRWAPGGAIAAGAAIGFVTAAAATAYYSSPPPQPGLCWYYTEPSRRSGFWDTCP